MGVLKELHGKIKYHSIRKIDGDHPMKERAPGAFVEYQARTRPGGDLVYFNFKLAKEMGLISANHPEIINDQLKSALLDTFGLIIINEYDITHNRKFPKKEIREKTFMATRYLQLQHQGHQGLRSGDGRSIWNGTVTHKGKTWDISSCGTGATCLSPAAAKNDIFYKSGDKTISYGCGYSNLSEGIIDVLFSEIFNSNNILTERTLCVIGYPGKMGITVRAGLNLLRPSHFFNHLRQSQYDRLKNVVDLYVERELTNGTWPPIPKGTNPYDYLVERTTETFAKITARFENDYIFCWLDWDGDNILANGGIIDYGSVRQFGLYHHSYQFDDDDRWSTNIKEQKNKAKDIIVTFCQLVDYLKTGVKKPLKEFQHSIHLSNFNNCFIQEKRFLLLRKIGFDDNQITHLIAKQKTNIAGFESLYYLFESARSSKGPIKVPDGINWNAVYCMRDILAKLPESLAKGNMSDKEFLEIMASKYADRQSKTLTPYKRRQIRDFQRYYLKMVRSVARKSGRSHQLILAGIAARSAAINSYERITGDSLCVIGDMLTKVYKKITTDEYHALISTFIDSQTGASEDKPEKKNHTLLSKSSQRRLKKMLIVLKEYREGI